jgi:DNA-binding NtrC family response regulator
MTTNVLLVADGDIGSDLTVVDAAARTGRRVRRASTHMRPFQILRAGLDDADAVIVNLDEHSQALCIIEELGCSADMPPVIVLTTSKMAPVASRHGATVCVLKPFTASELAAIINEVCGYPPLRNAQHQVGLSVQTPRSTLREPAE